MTESTKHYGDDIDGRLFSLLPPDHKFDAPLTGHDTRQLMARAVLCGMSLHELNVWYEERGRRYRAGLQIDAEPDPVA